MSEETPSDHPSRAAIAGHPIHPMLIPLPIGFLFGAWISDIVFAMTTNPFWAAAAFWLLVGGVASGLLAGLIGAIDFAAIPEARAHGSGWIHAGGNVVALVIAAINIWLRWSDPSRPIVPWGLVWTSIIVVLLGVTGWCGGELSYRHRIGVFTRKKRLADPGV